MCGIIRRDLRPVDQPPPSIKVVGAAILILQIIGMFPHIAAQKGQQGQNGVLIGNLLNGQISAAVGAEASPTGTENGQRGAFQGGLQPLYIAKDTADGAVQRRLGHGRRQGSERAEIEVMVKNAPCVVADALADLFRQVCPAFTPVSYTHLDVYKRQDGMTAGIRCIERREVRRRGTDADAV